MGLVTVAIAWLYLLSTVSAQPDSGTPFSNDATTFTVGDTYWGNGPYSMTDTEIVIDGNLVADGITISYGGTNNKIRVGVEATGQSVDFNNVIFEPRSDGDSLTIDFENDSGWSINSVSFTGCEINLGTVQNAGGSPLTLEAPVVLSARDLVISDTDFTVTYQSGLGWVTDDDFERDLGKYDHSVVLVRWVEDHSASFSTEIRDVDIITRGSDETDCYSLSRVDDAFCEYRDETDSEVFVKSGWPAGLVLESVNGASYDGNVTLSNVRSSVPGGIVIEKGLKSVIVEESLARYFRAEEVSSVTMNAVVLEGLELNGRKEAVEYDLANVTIAATQPCDQPVAISGKFEEVLNLVGWSVPWEERVNVDTIRYLSLSVYDSNFNEDNLLVRFDESTEWRGDIRCQDFWQIAYGVALLAFSLFMSWFFWQLRNDNVYVRGGCGNCCASKEQFKESKRARRAARRELAREQAAERRDLEEYDAPPKPSYPTGNLEVPGGHRGRSRSRGSRNSKKRKSPRRPSRSPARVVPFQPSGDDMVDYDALLEQPSTPAAPSAPITPSADFVYQAEDEAPAKTAPSAPSYSYTIDDEFDDAPPAYHL